MYVIMAIRCKNVVLCKGISEKDETQESYVKTLESAGYTCDCLNTLSFKFINIAELRKRLSTPELYFGLILTSRRAAEAVKLASNGEKDLLSPWENLATYCIGPATESFAREHLGSQNCLGSQAGNAKELAEQIIKDLEKDSKPLLYPCSEIARETLQQILNDDGLATEKIITYQTLASESLENDLLNIIKVLPRIFVFFSPSTVEYIVNLLKKHGSDLKSIKAAAIGPVTKQALLDSGFNIYATAEKPNPEALLVAIQNAEESENSEKTAT